MTFLEPLTKWWKEASSLARAFLVGGLITVLGGLGFAVSHQPDEDYALLYGHLTNADAGEVIEALRDKKTPYRLEDGGTTVFVPRARVYELRADLARAKLPRGGAGSDGNELFDKDTWMINDATQRVNIRRALEGELQRTLMKFPQIELARVHLAIPENSLMRRERFEPSASVVLKLRSGEVMDRETVAGIRHLISASVSNLPAERVALLDGEGRLLDDASSNKGAGIGTELEARLEKRITELLEPMIGTGHVVASVSAEMDLAKVQETAEQFDPESATIHTQTKQEDNANQKKNEPGMAAGTPSNIPQQAVSLGGQPLFQSSSGRSAIATEYAISKVTRHTDRPFGELKRLSIAVLVDAGQGDGPPKADGVDAPGGVEQRRALPLPSQAAIAELVKKAAGFNAERGDQIEVLFVPFSRPEIGEMPAVEAAATAFAIPGWLPVTVITGLGFALVAGSLLTTERRRKAEALAAQKREQEAKKAEAAIAALKSDGKSPDGSKDGERSPRDGVRALGPEAANAGVSVLKEWLTLDASKRGA